MSNSATLLTDPKKVGFLVGLVFTYSALFDRNRTIASFSASNFFRIAPNSSVVGTSLMLSTLISGAMTASRSLKAFSQTRIEADLPGQEMLIPPH